MKNSISLLFDVVVEIQSFSYDDKKIFESLNFELVAGKWTCLLGSSGIGKTTLLKILANLIGENQNLRIQCSDGSPLNGRISYMAQQDLLMPWLSVFDNVTIGEKLRGSNSKTKFGIAHELLDRVGVREYSKELPSKLSGGMRQRVALARTLLEDKPVVLMYEPFSAVDVITRIKLQDMAADLLKDKTVLLVTHDPLEALRLGNIIYVMKGCPSKLEKFAELTDEPPRIPHNQKLLEQQAALFIELGEYKHGAAQ